MRNQSGDTLTAQRSGVSQCCDKPLKFYWQFLFVALPPSSATFGATRQTTTTDQIGRPPTTSPCAIDSIPAGPTPRHRRLRKGLKRRGHAVDTGQHHADMPPAGVSAAMTAAAVETISTGEPTVPSALASANDLQRRMRGVRRVTGFPLVVSQTAGPRRIVLVAYALIMALPRMCFVDVSRKIDLTPSLAVHRSPNDAERCRRSTER